MGLNLRYRQRQSCLLRFGTVGETELIQPGEFTNYSLRYRRYRFELETAPVLFVN
jgi:hypothetical protein